MLNKVFKVIDNILKAAVIVIVASFVVIVFAQVIARYVFNHSLTWTEELARVLFTQAIFLASPLLVLEKKHIAVDIVLQFLSTKGKRYFYVFINAVNFAFFAVLGYSGVKFAATTLPQKTAAMGLSMNALYWVIPVSAVLMMINTIRAGYDDFTNTYAGKEESK